MHCIRQNSSDVSEQRTSFDFKVEDEMSEVATGLHSRSIPEDSCSLRGILLLSYVALSLISTKAFLYNGILHCELCADLSVYDLLCSVCPIPAPIKFLTDLFKRYGSHHGVDRKKI